MNDYERKIKIKSPLELDRIILGALGKTRGINLIAATEEPDSLADLIIAVEDAVDMGLVSREEAEKFLRPFILKSTAKYLKKYRDIIGARELWIGVPDEVFDKIIKERLKKLSRGYPNVPSGSNKESI